MDYYTVIEPVANLRREPLAGAVSYCHDDLEETQLLFNEKVLVVDEKGEWLFVEAVEQMTFRKTGQWQGYPGWVEKRCLEPAPRNPALKTGIVTSAMAPVYGDPDTARGILFSLSFATRVDICPATAPHGRFCPIDAGSGRRGWLDPACVRTAKHAGDEDGLREEILASARLFLGTPYLWGGRSMHMPGLASVATGVDCSGLVNLLFRASGIDVPRDANEQWMKTDRITPDALKPGDLIFITPRSGEAAHVMLFAGGESFIEAAESGSAVRTGTFMERFGVLRANLPGALPGGGAPTVSFGRAPLWP
jgi:gamma-D-glutamyl-L-lysine dipeptidyl-peptidase